MFNLPVPPPPPFADVRPAEHAAEPVRLPKASAPTAYWTEDELCRLFGLPRVLVTALAPVAVLDKRRSFDRGAFGESLYDPELVADALKAAGHVHAARRLERDPECEDLEVDLADVSWDEADAEWGHVGLGAEAEPIRCRTVADVVAMPR